MSSSRAAEYRELIEDLVNNAALLDPEERMELRDLLERIKRKMLANMPASAYQEAE